MTDANGLGYSLLVIDGADGALEPLSRGVGCLDVPFPLPIVGASGAEPEATAAAATRDPFVVDMIDVEARQLVAGTIHIVNARRGAAVSGTTIAAHGPDGPTSISS